MKENQWIETKKELPPCDGIYEITNFRWDLSPFDTELCVYDGYGFLFNGTYRHPKFWRETAYTRKKKYGKVNNDG